MQAGVEWRVLTGAALSPKAPVASLWKQSIWQTGLERWSALRLMVNFKFLVTLTSSDA